MSTPVRFRESDGCRIHELPDADVRYWPTAFEPAESARLFAELRDGIDWREEEVLIFGRRRAVPRRVAWHGDSRARYRYSGTEHEPLPWTPTLLEVRDRVLGITGLPFNAVLLNLYRDGRDGMGWHADDEPELGPEPAIASVSFGAGRRFCLRHRRRPDARLELLLGDGSLLLMRGPTQRHWVHAVPKTARPVGERINLTFRQVLAQPR
ncbi:MAG: alpha-ketoglutarate-dependent dioxygenase AlkB [Steroidobacteraceae bacterium]